MFTKPPKPQTVQYRIRVYDPIRPLWATMNICNIYGLFAVNYYDFFLLRIFEEQNKFFSYSKYFESV